MGQKELLPELVAVNGKPEDGLGDEEQDSKGGTLPPEVLNITSVEVRFGNPEVDAPRLLELFTQPKTIEHLAGIVLKPYKEIVEDPITKEKVEKFIPATTADDIRNMYENPDHILLTAETPSGIIVGTYSLQRPGRGSRAAEGGLFAVDEEYRGKKIGTKLLKSGNALMFREGSGGFDCNLADVFVIFGVDGYNIALNAFNKEGFAIKEQRVGGTHSWSHELGKLVDRTSIHMTLERKQYKQDFPGDHTRYFPTPRPPKAA